MNSNQNDIPQYSIGETSRRVGVSVQTLRLYESEGLIISERSDGNQRLYSESDIERIECIRHALNEEKISLAGIRRIQSFIPCWEVMNCTHEQRWACPAFSEHTGGCWTLVHSQNVCAGRDCRSCEVYKLSTNCGQIKKFIAGLFEHHIAQPVTDSTKPDNP